MICDPNQIPQLEGKHIWKQIGSCLVYLLPPPKNSCKLSLLILEAFHLLDPFVRGKASNVCFVPTRPALMNIPAAFLSVMGMRGWRVSRPTGRPLNLAPFAPKTSQPRFFALGMVCSCSGQDLFAAQPGRDKMQRGQEVRQVCARQIGRQGTQQRIYL